MRKNIVRNLLVLLIFLALSAACIFAAAIHQHTRPAEALNEELRNLQLETADAGSISLTQSGENENLSNKITQQQRQERKEKQKKQQESEQSGREQQDEHSDQQNSNDGGSSDRNNQSDQNEELPNDGQQSENDQGGSGTISEEYEDLPEDAYAETTISVDDLVKELGISDPEQIIYAKAVTGAGEESLLKLVNGVYTALVSTQGTTIIQVKYTDDNGKVQIYNKKVIYKRPEGSTPEAKRPVITTSLTNEATYTNRTLNFDVWVTNYRGKPLAYNNIEVTVNDGFADYIGEMDRQTYSADLKVGANIIKIKVTDSYQYTVTKIYTVYYKSGKGSITISLEAGTVGLPYLISPMKMEVESGTPLSAVVDEFLTANGFSYSSTGTIEEGFYLARVSKGGLLTNHKIPPELIAKIKEDGLIFNENNYENTDSLGEKDFCQDAGWMYSINGVYSTYGFSQAYVQDGDVVRIRFTLAGGKDIGAGGMSGSGNLTDYGKEW